tara:strand:- start:4280 stop:4915 length:636 start_codon:yes stop_codon:yes gene_type:complete
MKINASEKLWEENLDIAKLNLNTNFVKAIKDGSLPEKAFKSYIAQDAYFLEAFAKGYAMLIFNSIDKEMMSDLVGLLVGVEEELKLHSKYMKSLNINLESFSPRTETSNYIDFLLNTASKGSSIEILSAMNPCMKLYSWISKEILPGSNISENKYSEWINTYSGEDFEKLSLILESNLNRLFNLDEINFHAISSIYRQALEFELDFFKAFY